LNRLGALALPFTRRVGPGIFEREKRKMGIADFAHDAYQKLLGKKREWQVAIDGDVDDLVVDVALAELGLSKRGEPFDLDHAAEILDASGLPEPEFRARVDKYKHRLGLKERGALLPERQAKRAEADRRYRDADVEEASRHAAAMQKIDGLREAVRQAQLEVEDAIEALSDLQAGAAVLPEEHELVAQVAKFQKRVRELRAAVDPNQPPPGLGSPMLPQNPAGLLRVSQRELSELGKAAVEQPGRRTALKNTIQAATAAVEAARDELVGVEKEIAALQMRLAELAKRRLDPENFSLPRARPSRDQEAKRAAAAIGFYAEQ
jgi:hypothetical protein